VTAKETSPHDKTQKPGVPAAGWWKDKEAKETAMATQSTVGHEIYMTTMSPAEWAEVPDNPRQRDTVKRAMQAKHLYNLESSHLLVHMAEWPGGRCKLEGHTRAKVWSDRPEISPEQIDVRVYVVDDIEEAKRLYGHFNSKEEGETATDRLFGAMRECGIEPQSALVRRARFSNAVKSALGYVCGMSVNSTGTHSTSKHSSVYEAVEEFRDEIRALDLIDLSNHKAYGPVLCCYFMAYRKHGSQVNEFFARYASDAGVKEGKHKDCVQLFAEAMDAFRLVGSAGFEPFNESCRIGLACIDRWTKSPSSMFSRSPKCDPFEYLD
jgi:hypothetical protein